MKWFDRLRDSRHGQSLSLRRAWIEICRSVTSWSRRICRSPYGERGLKYLSCAWHAPLILSLSLRRAWIEIIIVSPFADALRCRSPYGDRGLKCRHGELRRPIAESLSLRRAWIEMDSRPRLRCLPRRSPYGERGLKYQGVRRHDLGPRRSPYGERGLKWLHHPELA